MLTLITAVVVGMLISLMGFISLDSGKGLFAFLMFLAFIAWAWMFSVFDVWHLAITDPVSLIIYMLCYAVIGIMWTVPKWVWHIRDEMANIDVGVLRNRYKESDNKNTFKEWLYEQKPYLKPENNKEVIFVWAILWPLSLIWEVLHRPIRIAIDWLCNTYNRINDRLLSRMGIKD